MKTSRIEHMLLSIALVAGLSFTYAIADSDTDYRCGHGPYYYEQSYGMQGQGMMG